MKNKIKGVGGGEEARLEEREKLRMEEKEERKLRQTYGASEIRYLPVGGKKTGREWSPKIVFTGHSSSRAQ